MPINVSWDNSYKTAILIDCIVPWTWGEFDQAVDQTFAMIKTADHIVHTILNVPQRDMAPQGSPLIHMMRMIRLRPKNLGVAIIVGEQRRHSFLKQISMIVRKMNKSVDEMTKNAESLEEARAMIAVLEHATTPRDQQL
jgi:hypothetical protein